MSKTGVYEWADKSINMQIGCEHDCRYCYARYRAVERYRYCPSNEAWRNPVANKQKTEKGYRTNYGTVMFPSTHDITPDNVHGCLSVIEKLLKAGNNALIVTKPHFDCIELMCRHLKDYKDKVLFRFTIGSMSNRVLKFWEPGAPNFSERLRCLKWAFSEGFKTSVSCEPYLDANVAMTYFECRPYLTDSFWIGKMRGWHRVNLADVSPEKIKHYVDTLKKAQTDDFVKSLYQYLDGQPFIRWKDSIQEVIQKERILTCLS